ncbi:MAG: AzlD domain-containing protein [Halieaceae bacterium]|jgi:branched-subunit amino acid transport protein|nr:AzlD domain-containing protein [Halieaceae bacterium]
MMILLTILMMGLGSYAMRAVFILLLSNRSFPPSALKALEYVGPAVMAALVMTMLLSPEGGSAPGVNEWAGLVTAAVVALVTRNHIYVLTLAMAVYWGVGYLV